jgi:hypothetical protein
MSQETQNNYLYQIPPTSYQWAQLFASKQTNSVIGKQVYHNTLSVLAVDEYLQSQGIATNLENSASWYPGLTSIPNSSELQVAGLGMIACPPLLASETQVTLPTTSPDIASVVVQISADLTTAKICGYALASQTGSITISDLHQIDNFPDYLGCLRDGYGRFEAIDLETSDPLMGEFLAELGERGFMNFLVSSQQIHSSQERVFSKRLQLQELMGSSCDLVGQKRSINSDSSEKLEEEDRIRNLASSWLTILSQIFPNAR